MSKNIHLPIERTQLLPGFSYYFHLPYYRLIKYGVDLKFEKTVFFDSVLFATLLLTYPIYLTLWGGLLWAIGVPEFIILPLLIVIPIMAQKSIKLK
jgi:hypothetical protein